ncbi:MAG: hypothetical protein QOE70_3444 [Chthoniobacter sp.]|jgi:hypothetical protein|nr:hypothetical protein [Chthoniobacter sp.]
MMISIPAPSHWRARARLCLAILALFLTATAQAHVGSPDVFFAGKAGPYPVQVTVRVPPVVPGLARIEVRPQTSTAVAVSVLPLYSKTAVKNTPPAEEARPVTGDPGLYGGDLWLMSVGGYSIEVRVTGPEGEGRIQVPVNSVATHQLPLPPFLGKLLGGLCMLLFVGAAAIVSAAAGESTLAPGLVPDRPMRRKAWIAGAVTTVVLVLLLAGGWRWWSFSEEEFRRTLREGAWPDLAATVETRGPQRFLHLTLGEKTFPPNQAIPLLPDHGKLLHAFLIREPDRDVFAHVHPIRKGPNTFDLTLPALPEGDYRILCDCTLSETGLSSTATTTIHLPPPPGADAGAAPGQADPDDSWAQGQPGETRVALSGGREAVWLPHPPLRARSSAHLDFRFVDAAGAPLPLEPYMGMLSHAAVLRADGKVFSHLHPTGNYSMAAQTYFDRKLARETSASGGTDGSIEMDHSKLDHSKMAHGAAAPNGNSTVSLPYEFPAPGEYNIWVQIKSGGEVLTAPFRVNVAP